MPQGHRRPQTKLSVNWKLVFFLCTPLGHSSGIRCTHTFGDLLEFAGDPAPSFSFLPSNVKHIQKQKERRSSLSKNIKQQQQHSAKPKTGDLLMRGGGTNGFSDRLIRWQKGRTNYPSVINIRGLLLEKHSSMHVCPGEGKLSIEDTVIGSNRTANNTHKIFF